MLIKQHQVFLCCLMLLVQSSLQTDEVCLPVRRDRDAIPTSSSPNVQQGRPGKLGPMGLPGQKGEPGTAGPNGQCVCDVNEKVENLELRLQNLEDVIGRIEGYLGDKYKVASCLVGFKSGEVSNEDLTSSSALHNNYAARYGRLDNVQSGSNGGFWHTANNRRVAGEWIQVDLRTPTRLTGVVTQGRSNADQWITSYKIMFGNSTDALEAIQDDEGNDIVFQGNRDRNSYVINMFPQPVVARYFRLVVQTWQHWPVIRMDYLTC